MKNQDFMNLASKLEQGKYVHNMGREGAKEATGLLDFLAAQATTPYYNYVLCIWGEKGESLPFYVGYTGDLARRIATHAARVEFDWIYIYHAPSKEIALANEQTLMDLLGTRDLFNGQLTQLSSVSHEQIAEAIQGLDMPIDKIQRYAEANDIRKTYYINYVIDEALRMYGYDHRTEVSATLRQCLVTGIPENYLEAAYQQLYGRKEAQ